MKKIISVSMLMFVLATNSFAINCTFYGNCQTDKQPILQDAASKYLGICW